MTSQEWIGAVIGGLIGLVLSAYAFLVVPTADIFAEVNLTIFSFGLSASGLLVCAIFYEIGFETEKASRLAKALSWAKVTVIEALMGAIFGLMFGYFTQTDLRWSILAFAIAWAIPGLNLLTTIGSAPVFLIICGIKYGPGLGERVSVLQKMPTSMRWVGAPFFVPILAIPFLAFLGLVVGGFVEDKVNMARLKLIEKRIKSLEEIIKKYQTVLDQRNQLERSIDRIIVKDPPNFRFKATLFSRQAKELETDNIRKRIIEIEEEIKRHNQLTKQAKEKLEALESERETLESKLNATRNRLHILEEIDPANVRIKMQKLQVAWKNVSREELEKIEALGELETLFKEQILLNIQIEEKNNEIENQRKEVVHLNIIEDTLRLKRYVLELEMMDRKIKDEEPHLLELKDKLTNLQTKRDKIRQFLRKQS